MGVLLKAGEQMYRQSLFCSAPAGVVGTASLDMIGVPSAGEIMLLVVAVSFFLAMGQWIFGRWGRPSATQTIGAQSPLAAQSRAARIIPDPLEPIAGALAP
jgi:hypothetical protein